jgi:ComF family protein
MVDNRLAFIQRLLLPPVCLLCDTPVANSATDLDICPDCLAELSFVTGPRCCRCAVSLTASSLGTDTPLICGRCLRDPPDFDDVVPVFAYQGLVARLIQGLKFNGRLSHARLLGSLMGLSLRDSVLDLPELLLPVPLHHRRLRERGFNQSLELARHINRYVGHRQILADTCVRQRYTTSQADLPARQRRRNVRNVFYCRAKIQNRHVAIIDDVMTTGSTVDELAHVLKMAGAGRVVVWVCARASH